MSSYRNFSYNRTGQSELLSSAATPVVVFCALLVFDYMYKVSTDRSLRFITVLDYTANSSDGITTIPQDPSKLNAVQLGLSVNERSGVEFAYSFFLNVNQNTFSGNDELFHVFHKGYPSMWPLFGPGVFINGKDNTMRIFMNTNKNVLLSADITNIPVAKWFHIVLNCYNSGLDIYINGNLAHRLSFNGSVVYQNFQDLILFSPNRITISNTVAPAVGTSPLVISGAMSGMISSMKYARYSLSLKEITALMGAGPSSNIKSTSVNTDTTYLSETWWADQK